MAEGKSATTKKASQAAGNGANRWTKAFTAEERAAMKERVREMKAAGKGKADGERDFLAKIAAMQEPDRVKAQRLHAIVKATTPTLAPRTWYGMPAYAKDGKVICYFQSAEKFKSRYATVGFSGAATSTKARCGRSPSRSRS